MKRGLVARALSLALVLVIAIGSVAMLDFGAATVYAEAYGGVLNVTDCTARHWCHSADGLSASLSNSTVNAVLADIAAASSGDRIFLHLDDDMSVDTTLPEGVKVGVCLNGHTLDGSILDCEGLYTYDCEMHICSSLDSAVVYVDQAWADMHTVYIDGASYLEYGLYGATVVPTENIVLPDGTSLMVSLDAKIEDYLTEITVTSAGDDGTEVTTVETLLDLSLIPYVSISVGEYAVTGLGAEVVYMLSDKQMHRTEWSNAGVSYCYTMTYFSETRLTISDTGTSFTTVTYSASEGTDLNFVCHEYTVNDDLVTSDGSYGTVGELTVLGDGGSCECGEAHSCEKLASLESATLSAGIAKYLFAPDGTLRLDGGECEMYLTGDTVLPSALVIPTAVQLKICLNGFTLSAEYYDGDSSYSSLYYYDAVDNIMRPWSAGGDMPNYTGSVTSIKTYVCDRDLVYDSVVVEKGASLTVFDCSPDGTGAVSAPVVADGTTSIYTNGIVNAGTLCLDGVDVLNGGAAAVNNTGSCTISGGELIGTIAGVSSSGANASLVITDGAVVAGAFYGAMIDGGEVVIDNSEIVALRAGVVVASGDAEITDSSISGSISGVVVGGDSDTSDSEAVLTIGGGEINVGYVDRINELYGAEVSVADLGDQTSFVGITASGAVTLTDDVDVNTEPTIELLGAMAGITVSDIAVQQGSDITVADGKELENVYTVAVIASEDAETSDASVILPDESYDTFVGAVGYATAFNGNDDYVVISAENAAITANLYSMEFSADGAYVITLYSVITDDFLTDAASRLVVDWKGESHDYAVGDMTYEVALTDELATDGYYVYSIDLNIAPKDFMEELVYHYENASMRWSYGTVALDGYFKGMLAYDDGSEESAVMVGFITALRSSCMAAAEKFGTVDITADEVSTEVGSVSAEQLSEWARVAEGEMHGFRMHSATLLLESRCAMRFYFLLDQGVSIEDIAITVDGAAKEATAFNSAGMYYVEIDGVNPAELGVMRQVAIGDYSFSYSPLTYAYNVLTKSASYTKSDINIAVSLYNVYLTAASYYGIDAGDAVSGETA